MNAKNGPGELAPFHGISRSVSTVERVDESRRVDSLFPIPASFVPHFLGNIVFEIGPRLTLYDFLWGRCGTIIARREIYREI